MADDELVVMADRCKSTYTMFRRMLAGHPKYRPGERWEPYFLKLAVLIKDNDYDLSAYIKAQFVAGIVCQPNMLTSQAAVDRYKACTGATAEGVEVDATERMTLERERRFMFDTGYIKTRLSVGLTLERILEHSGSPLSALTRYCLGRQNGLESVCLKYRKAAEAQLYTAPDHYRKLYGELLGDLDEQRERG